MNKVAVSQSPWSIINRDHTRLKHNITRSAFEVWLTIWNGPRQQWIEKNIYVVDLFAGPGYCYDEKGKRESSGSPIIFLEEILKKKQKIIGNQICIEMFLVEKDLDAFKELKINTEKFIKDNNLRKVVKITYYNDDCNLSINDILYNIKKTQKRPVFFFVDPWGLQTDKETIKKIVNLPNKKDIIMNYMLEGIKRVVGVYEKVVFAHSEDLKELNTAKRLQKFLGSAISPYQNLNQTKKHLEVLVGYCEVFNNAELNVVLFDMRHQSKNKIIYVLLHACSNNTITNVIDSIMKSEQQKNMPQRILITDAVTKKLLKKKR